MTRDEILMMPAGRELDALIAKKVMGWELGSNSIKEDATANCWKTGNGVEFKIHHYIDWSPSISINAAWEVVEKMRTSDYFYIHAHSNGYSIMHGFYQDHLVTMEDAPLAICLAALLIVMKEES